MYMTSLERIWGYLHDDKRCVQEYLFVLDIYRYTSDFVDLIFRNPEVLPQLRDRIKREKMNSGFLGLLFRDGYGLAEYRLIRMMQVEAFREILANNFQELDESVSSPKLSRNIR